MTDLELLFLVLGVIYVWECGWWARCGAVAFRTWLSKRWSIALPSRLLGNQQAGMIFAPPLPPLGTLLSSQPFPLSVSADGLLAHLPPSIDPARRMVLSGQFFPFQEIQRVEASGKRVRVNGKLFLSVSSPELANDFVETIEGLRKLPASDRKRTIEREIESSFQTQEIKRRWNEFQAETQGLRFNTNLLFLYLFGIVPLVLWRLGLSITWPWLLVGLLACTLTIALQFHRIHKRLYPRSEDERFTHFLILLLSPASAVRARDVLTRPLLEKFHPLAVAQVFCSKRAFEKLAEPFLRELRYPALPLCPRAEPLAQAIERSARELLLRTMEAFLRRHGCRLEQLLQPPQQSDPSSRSFCPRCHSQFTVVGTSCEDCGGLKVIRFATEVPSVESSKA